MAKQTLWQRWTAPKPPPPRPDLKYNPLGVKIGVTCLQVHLPEYEATVPSRVSGAREIVRKINGNEHRMTDYYLLDNSTANKLRLRAMPDPEQYMMLGLYHDMLFDEEVLKICQNGTEFQVTDHDNNNEVSNYWRIGDNKRTQEAAVQFFDGGFGVHRYRMDYWDYSRITKDEAGHNREEFFFVEMEKNSGRMQMWRGELVNRSRIVVL